MVKIVSSEDSKNTGRPGFRGFVQNVSNTSKASVRRLMVKDPSKGISQPAADKITSTHIDVVGGAAKGSPVGRTSPTSFGKDRKTIRAASSRLKKR